MSLFSFKKKTSNHSDIVRRSKITCIKVLGSGCKSCRKQFENVESAAAEIGLNTEIEYITDMSKIMEYGVMSMPAIVINEKVVFAGKVLTIAGVIKLFGEVGD